MGGSRGALFDTPLACDDFFSEEATISVPSKTLLPFPLFSSEEAY